ncbi:hypothetical protein [Kitasatospora purpeofusca]|uniref:hypothetical protein n=1 Tax=Kitasatospora purpeofusca TaxID=67352 RepID=UPI00224D3A35|nr:hypothetical protein [Kitasatospora purpeofusca]MCX4682731.1 hypothetical protein [Kitasatospora purpeofusca]MCX4690605.1 hypothetical protein [Kitasatospora purpeofusca]MCX4690787.1 hypothetical protein [Kitasatospora purpeofusca]
MRKQAELDDRIVIEFRQRITRARPGTHCALEVPGGPDRSAEGPAEELPPAVAVHGGRDDEGPPAVERPRRPVDTAEVTKRTRAIQARYGFRAR